MAERYSSDEGASMDECGSETSYTQVCRDESDIILEAEKMLKHMTKKGALTEEEKEKAILEMKRAKKFGLMACGLTGSGKSTLLNGIAGDCVFKEGDSLQHETVEVQKHSLKKHSSTLVICDTPGFCDSSGDEKKYIKKIRETCCDDVDMLLYCFSMQTPKAKVEDDLKTLKKLRKALKSEVWDHCIVVLTFANVEVLRIQQRKIRNVDGQFKTMLAEWETKIKRTLIEAGIDPSKIPIVPAGIKNKPQLLRSADDNWLSHLWRTVYDKATSDGQTVLTVLNADRIKSRSEVDEAVYRTKELYEQPILPSKNWKDKLRDKFPFIAGALGAGGAAGATGATIGAVIGALAIGIPSFGIAAGMGLLLGAAIGGGAGIGVGVITAKAVEVVKMKQEEKKEMEETAEESD